MAAGGEFDSLTLKLELQFNDFASFDSIESSISHMERLVSEESDASLRKLKMERTLYWRARYLRRLEYQDSSLKIANDALALNDSSAHKYDRLRIISLMYAPNDSMDGATQYRHFEECIDYGCSIDDKALVANSAEVLGTLLGKIGEYEKALHYFHISDSLNEFLGGGPILVKNQINVALIMQEIGVKETGDSILRALMGHPYLKKDTFAMNLLPRNLYSSYNDSIHYLYQAYVEIKDNPRFRFLHGLYYALLANHHYRVGVYDSCIYYARKAQRELPFVRKYSDKALIWLNMSLAWQVLGQSDSALECRIRYELYMDSAQTQRRVSEVLRLSALHELGAREEAYKASLLRRNMMIVLVVVVLVSGGLLLAMWQNRRHLRQKMKAMQSELELEKAKRKMAATALTIEEKDKVLGSLKAELTEMRHEGDIKEGDARRLESTIKSHLLERDNDEAFQNMFDVVNPGFTERLRARCPNLAESYVKLACYILMELDNKKIASLMMIRLESVHQSRWRLRQRLNIPEGETLESFLRRLNDPQRQ